MRVLALAIDSAVALYLVVLAIFFVIQRRLLYYPSRQYIAPGDAHANPAFREISVRTADGIDLKAWYAPATSKQFTIVFFHGNADSLDTASQVADPYIAAGYGFLVAEYRGYSGLPGKPTEKGLYLDARASLNILKGLGTPEENVLLYGHSMGAGVAVQMASEFRVGGLMLLAPYLSVPKVAHVSFPFFPLSLLVLDRFDNEKKIGRLHTPVVIANGSRDDVVPDSQGKKLYARANRPREFHSLVHRGHNDAFDDFVPLSLNWLQQLGNHS